MNADNRKWKDQCPARMEDGRLFTSYMPADRYNMLFMRKFGITDPSHEYRHFMTKNAKEIKKMEEEFFRSRYMCNSHSPGSHYYSLFGEE
jgi:hypothetical protein